MGLRSAARRPWTGGGQPLPLRAWKTARRSTPCDGSSDQQREENKKRERERETRKRESGRKKKPNPGAVATWQEQRALGDVQGQDQRSSDGSALKGPLAQDNCSRSRTLTCQNARRKVLLLLKAVL